MNSIFPFFVSLNEFTTFINSFNITISDDTLLICYFIFSFANVYFILTILKIAIKLFKKIIRLLVR